MDRDRERGRRFDDGEVVRYGAGESWRPTPRDRSPRRARSPRSPPRERSRPPRSPRPRSPRPRSPGVSASDSYVPGRYPPPPRRRSRSIGDRYRRDRSRDRESPRRRERSRSPMGRRSPPPRRSPFRRGSPMRDNRYERDRPRSPRRDWDRERDWERDRPRERESVDRRDDRRVSRSRSPFARDRRSPGKATPLGAGGSFRPRSRSPARRDERYQPYRRPSPARDSGISSALPSQPASGRASPLPRVRSPYHSRDQSPRYGDGSGPTSLRDGLAGNKSPPRGPAALRNAPTGPSSNRPLGTPGAQPSPSRTPGPVQRSDTASPTMPPSGPRYMPPSRGGFSSRGGRGGWSSQTPTRAGPSPGPSTPLGASGIPTGPRSASISGQGSSTPTHGRPFNPPTGPSAQHGASGPRQSLAQSLLATMPPLVPGGKLDSSMLPLVLGVSRDVEPHFRKLRDEEEKLRDDLRSKQERLRKSLYVWSRLERDAAAWEMRSDLSEKSMKNLAGEGMGGAAF